MTGYIIRRVLRAIVLLLVVSSVTFAIFYLFPSGDPAVLRAGPHPTPQLIATIRHRLGLNHAWYVQYFDYVRAIILHFDFGYSYQSHIAVGTQFFNRVPATISLMVGAAILWLLTGTAIATIAAARRGSPFDRFVRGGALFAISAPAFWLGMMSLYLLASDAGKLPILPGAGSYVPFTHDPGKWFSSLVLPWIVLAVGFAAIYARVLRVTLADTLPETYISTARAKGLSERRVIARHALRAAVVPIVGIAGIDIGILLGGAILVETVFNIPGIGRLTYDSIQTADLAMIQGTVLLAASIVLIAGLVVDISRGLIDPRVRHR